MAGDQYGVINKALYCEEKVLVLWHWTEWENIKIQEKVGFFFTSGIYHQTNCESLMIWFTGFWLSLYLWFQWNKVFEIEHLA